MARNTRLSLVLAAAMFVLVVDTSLMNVSISAVVRDLDTTVSSVQSAMGLGARALAVVLAQSLTAIIVFWAIVGGLGASLLLPAMQSLIHGSFEGAAQKKTYALVGAAAAIAAAGRAPLRGVPTPYPFWRGGCLLGHVVIAVVLSQVGRLKDVPYTGERRIDSVGAGLSVIGMGGVVLGILVWQEGGDYVVL